MRKISAVTVARSDYGIYRSVFRAVEADSGLELRLIVAAAHLAAEFGNSVGEIAADGFDIVHRVDMLRAEDSPRGIAQSMARGLEGFARVFEQDPPDLLFVLGDRFEMHAATLAALPFRIPVAHIHGGELTEGAIDDALRHSITKLSHLHFVATEEYATRVRQLGEEPWRVVVSGAPGLDGLETMSMWSRDSVIDQLGPLLRDPPLLVTYHPVTLEYEGTEHQVRELLAAVDGFEGPILFTAPNADTSGREVRRMIEEFVAGRERAQLAENLGTEGYFGLMAYARAMVGNSSSGIIEASSFRLPVVNVGNRQKGRVRAANVIDVECTRTAIRMGIERALDPVFRESLTEITNPYGSGGAAGVIIATIKRFEQRDLIPKKFNDMSSDNAVHVALHGSRRE